MTRSRFSQVFLSLCVLALVFSLSACSFLATKQVPAPDSWIYQWDARGILGQVDNHDGSTSIVLMAQGGSVSEIWKYPSAEKYDEFSLSPDGKTLLLDWEYTTGPEGSPTSREVLSVDLTTGTMVTLAGGASDWAIHPALSPQGDFIAFSQIDPGPNGWDIFLMNPDGAEKINITNSKEEDWWPSWSRDEKQIAFVSGRDSKVEALYVMNADGSDPKKVAAVSDADSLWNPTWSWDGTKIAFSVLKSDHTAAIYVVNADGTGLANVTDSFGLQYAVTPLWSPDSDQFAFMTGKGVQLATLDSSGVWTQAPFTVIGK